MYFSPQPLYGGGRGAAPQLVSQHCSAQFYARRWRLKHRAVMMSTALLGGPRELAGWPWLTRCGMGWVGIIGCTLPALLRLSRLPGGAITRRPCAVQLIHVVPHL
jgi:hypothetical protein